jgi:uncharacterized protein (TIGR02246 family)
MRKILLSVLAGLLTLTACQPRVDNVQLRATIDGRNQEVGAAVAKGDAAAVAALYSPDAQMLPPNSAPVSGREGIQAAWSSFIGTGVKGLDLTALEVIGHGDTADEVGQYKLFGADEQVLDTGKYIVIWKRENGQWFLHRDIWNSSQPLPPPAPPAEPAPATEPAAADTPPTP